jgi:hypothetical protein
MEQVPHIENDSKPEKALVKVFKENIGVFVGEEHGDLSAIKLIHNALPKFKKQSLAIIFLEQFDQADQSIIDEYLESRDKSLITNYLADANGVKVMGIDDDRFSVPADNRDDVDNIWSRYIIDVTGGTTKFLILAGGGHSNNFPANKGVDVLLEIPSFDYNDSKCILHTTEQEPNTVVQGDGFDTDYYFRMDL